MSTGQTAIEVMSARGAQSTMMNMVGYMENVEVGDTATPMTLSRKQATPVKRHYCQ